MWQHGDGAREERAITDKQKAFQKYKQSGKKEDLDIYI